MTRDTIVVDRVAVVVVTIVTCLWWCFPHGNHLDNHYLHGCCHFDRCSEPCICFAMLHIHAREAHIPCLVTEPIEKVEAKKCVSPRLVKL
jgi:hypothetical protein